MESMFLTEHEFAPNCTASLNDGIDQGYFLWKNQTDPRSNFFDTSLNVTALISDSLARLTRFCPGAIEHQVIGYIHHFDQFKGASLGQIAESFMFGILIKSLEMRQTAQRIQMYDGQNDTAGIVKELVGFARTVIFFDNVYALDPTVKAAAVS